MEADVMPSALDEMKRRAADASLRLIRPGMVLGLGSGSTARFVLEGIAGLISDGMPLQGIPTSLATAKLARILRIPLTSLEEHPHPDLAIDGADEVDSKFNLIKGMGGALFRERIVAAAAKKFVVVVDGSKLVPRLGTKSPVPVEVHPFGWRTVEERLIGLGARPELRRRAGEPYQTDNANYILDAAFGPIRAPTRLAAELRAIPGVVDHGLFLGLARAIVVGTEKRTLMLRPTRRT